MFTKSITAVGLTILFLIVLFSCHKKESAKEITDYKKLTIDEVKDVISTIPKGSTEEDVGKRFGISKKEFWGKFKVMPSGPLGKRSLVLDFDKFFCIFDFDDVGKRGSGKTQWYLRKAIIIPPEDGIMPEAGKELPGVELAPSVEDSKEQPK